MKTMKKTLSLFVLCALLFCNLSFSGTILAFASVVPAESGQEETMWVSDCSAMNGEGPFSYYIEEDAPRAVGETFDLFFYVRDEGNIQNISYSAEGFTVNGEPLISDGCVQISVTHSIIAIEPQLEVVYTLNDELETVAGVYGICYEAGLFLSSSSHDSAMSKYV